MRIVPQIKHAQQPMPSQGSVTVGEMVKAPTSPLVTPSHVNPIHAAMKVCPDSHDLTPAIYGDHSCTYPEPNPNSSRDPDSPMPPTEGGRGCGTCDDNRHWMLLQLDCKVEDISALHQGQPQLFADPRGGMVVLECFVCGSVRTMRCKCTP